MKFNFNFFKYRYIAFIFSTLILLLSIFLFIYKNLNLGIDFKGGTMVEAKFQTTPDLTSLRAKIADLMIGNSEIQEFGDPQTVLIKLEKIARNINTKRILGTKLRVISLIEVAA